MDAYRTIFHRDGTVTVWDVYTQSWLRRWSPKRLRDEVVASLSGRERERMLARINGEGPQPLDDDETDN